ncbi:MAG: type II toxin-antitoxin system HicB family antitoxin [Candidatus Cloacimonetes bacterium]|nr:type II toxin-antitoxin system HicB family antitoxin [Candidatus Cloacimonadota bacterium]
MKKYKFRIIIEQDEDGIYIASCPALQGCYSQGDTIEEAKKNIEEAIRLHIEARQSVGEPVPVEVLMDEVEISV